DDALEQTPLRLERVAIGLLEADLSPRALAARLLARLARPGHDRALAEGVERVRQDPAEARAVGDQHRHRDDAPDDPEHRERASRAVARDVGPALGNQLAEHSSLPPRTGAPRSGRSRPRAGPGRPPPAARSCRGARRRAGPTTASAIDLRRTAASAAGATARTGRHPQ